ncbi:Lysine acetyltransferase protein [Lasiodiplodia theobromae]|uniref:Lysine acetyltransferase protein n=1 Tax=Lasiodiplodia theobromae TaxID=45133 RepID=UPI0015C30974|nr:Lysine acetyltransferase protein [Lasiodiplodia theobromae]KAF4534724.1 Lysine acetyltransferase protein [Lasiodiplodia theobromae]
MDHPTNHNPLPPSTSPHLHLAHPTPEELVHISTNTFSSWHDTLPLPDYLAESLYLSTVPLAKDNGLTTWILVDSRLPPNARPILSSCESYRKRCLTSDAGAGGSTVSDALVHGVASVFCAPPYRRRGYAARLMKELARVLRDWQTTAEEDGKRVAVVGSILYSDIGKTFYANLGWAPHPRNTHVAFAPQQQQKGIPQPSSSPPQAKAIAEGDLAAFCEEDEAMVRKAMARPLAPAPDGVEKEKKKMQQRASIVPDCDHMLWHLAKEAFATERLFGKVPRAKGAIAGAQGRRVWAIWTHRYYSHPDAVATSPESNDENVLYILRLVVEGDESADGIVWDDQKEKGKGEEEEEEEQARSLKAVLQAAQAEAAEWRLDRVVMWNPSPWVRRVITQSGLEHAVVEREEDAIASGLWYDENGGAGPAPLWMNNEHYAWC